MPIDEQQFNGKPLCLSGRFCLKCELHFWVSSLDCGNEIKAQTLSCPKCQTQGLTVPSVHFFAEKVTVEQGRVRAKQATMIVRAS